MESILTYVGIAIGLIILYRIFFVAEQAPPSTGVSSRRGKIKIRLFHCLVLPTHPLTPFRHCSTTDGCILLTHAMLPLLERAPVEHYKYYLERSSQHPRIDTKHIKGTTSYTFTITLFSVLYISHHLHITRDQARYWLLCQFYAALTKQNIVLIEAEEEIESEPLHIETKEEEPEIIPVEEPVLVSTSPPSLDTSFEQAFYRAQTDQLFPLDVQEEKEEPDPRPLTELLREKERAVFTQALHSKITHLFEHYEQSGTITQSEVQPSILKSSEWKFLLNGQEGILWTLGIVTYQEPQGKVFAHPLTTIIEMLDVWIEQQAW